MKSKYTQRNSPHYDSHAKKIKDVPIWKLFIDKSCHPKGEGYFDRSSKLGRPEPGYNAAMHSAFAYMLINLHKRLDAQEFKKIHHLCVAKVENVNSNEEHFNPASYAIDLTLVSQEAKKEWIDEKLILTFSDLKDHFSESEPQKFLSTLMPGSRGASINSNYMLFSPTEEQLEEIRDLVSERVNIIFVEYYDQIERSKNNDDKLTAIVSLCRKLEIGHFFADGNQRTIVFVLLNKLLLENGFYPVILEDPIVFDGYRSKSELVHFVKEGMEYFLSLTNKNEDKATPSSDLSLSTRALIEGDTGLFTSPEQANTPTPREEQELSLGVNK